MVDAIWMILLMSFLSGTATWPLSLVSSPPMSMYDLCTTADLHQIEELKNTLFEDLNISSTDLSNNVSSVYFGLLEEDWKRLLLLENRIPEGSILKSKLLVVFRILISALYQAHSTTFQQPEGQNSSFVGNEELNSIDSEEKSVSSELEFGESQNVGVVVHESKLNSQTTTSGSFTSNEVSNFFDSFDERFENSQPDSHADSTSYSKPSDILPDANDMDDVKESYNEETTTATVNSVVEDSIEYSEENDNDSLLSSKSLKTTSTSNPIPEHNVFQRVDADVTEASNAFTTELNKVTDLPEANSITNYPLVVTDYTQKGTYSTTTDESNLQQIDNNISSEYSPTTDHTTSVAHTKLLDPTSNDYRLSESRPTSDIFSFNSKEAVSTTNSIEDVIIYTRHSELIEPFSEQERMNIENNIDRISPHNFESTMNSFAATTESWENNRIIQNMDESDSLVNEVIIPMVRKSEELNKFADSDLVEENTEAVTSRGIYVTNDPSDSQMLISQSNWHLNKLNIHSTTENRDNTHEVSTINLNSFSSDDQDNKRTTFPETVTTVDRGFVNEMRYGNIGINDNDVSPVNYSPTNSYNANPTSRPAQKHIERVTNSEYDSLQSSTSQKDMFSSKNSGDGSSDTNLFSGNPEHALNEESRVFIQSTSLERNYFGPINTEDENNSRKPIYEKSDHVSTVESESLQSTSFERNHFSPKNEAFDVKPFSECSERNSSKENNSLQSSVEEPDVSIPTKDYALSHTASIFSSISEHMTTTQNDQLQSRIKESQYSSPKTNNEPSSTVQYGTNRFEDSLNAEEEELQSSSMEVHVISPTNDYKGRHFEQPIPDSSHHLSSVEHDRLQSNEDEEIVLSSTNDNNDNYGGTSSSGDSEHVLSTENNNFQRNSNEMSVFSPTNEHVVSHEIQHNSESSEPIPDLEHDSLHSGVAEKDVFIPTNDEDETSIIQSYPESSGEILSKESDEFHGSTDKKHGLEPKSDYEVNPTSQPLPETTEHRSSFENYHLQSKFDENYASNSTNNKYKIYAVQESSEGSEHDVLSAESEDVQGSSVERSISSPRDHQDATLPVRPVSESLEHISNVESFTPQSNTDEKDMFESESVFDAANKAIETFPDSLEHVSNTKDYHLKMDDVERSGFNQTNTDSGLSYNHSSFDSSKQTFSAEYDNVQSGSMEEHVFSTINTDNVTSTAQSIHERFEQTLITQVDGMQIKSIGGESKENHKLLTPYPYINMGGKKYISAENSEKEDDADESSSNQHINKQPLPTQSYNNLEIYSTHPYPYSLSNWRSRRDCHNGNNCVYVQHLEYRLDEHPSKRFVWAGQKKEKTLN